MFANQCDPLEHCNPILPLKFRKQRQLVHYHVEHGFLAPATGWRTCTITTEKAAELLAEYGPGRGWEWLIELHKL